MSHPAQSEAETGAVQSNGSPGAPARIVLDASGGDQPLQERVSGALAAAERYEDVEVLLCGPTDQLERALKQERRRPENLRILHAPDNIGMHEPPVQAVRERKQSSIVVGVKAVAAGEADAFVSAGNTGAVAAASTLMLGRLPGVQRPGLATAMRVIDSTVVAIDVGANVDCRPAHLLQYGIMGSVFAQEVIGIKQPRVGLLNVGEEDAKGNDLAKQSFELLSAAPINFVGNVEPEKLVYNGCDVVVCDGFVGNVMLKLGEGLFTKLIDWFKQEVPKKLKYKLGFMLCRSLFRDLKECSDYTEYGGAPLLGVDGVTIITHGSSGDRAIANAIREARSFVKGKVNDHIVNALKQGPLDEETG
jgi:glycerol-3-phosphate acyltransferase PlsX